MGKEGNSKEDNASSLAKNSGGGLRQRIFLPLLVIGASLGLIFTLSFGLFFQELLYDNLRSDTELLVNAISFNSSQSLSVQSLVGFLTSLGQGSEVDSIMIYDATNSSIYAESRAMVTDTQEFLNTRKELLEYLKTESAKDTDTELYQPREAGLFWIFRSVNLQNADTKVYFDAIVHIQIDANSFLTSINSSLLLITFSWLGCIAAILVFTSIFLWRTILSPSQTIIKTISKVEQGYEVQSIPEDYVGEIGTISKALNSYFKTILQQEQELKEKNHNLLAATKDAQEKGEAKTRFLANMSHEIRTPLNAVLGFSHLLTNTNLSAKQSDLVDSIKSSGESLLALINDILDFSKVESEAIEFDHRRFDLLDTIDSSLDVIASRVADSELGFGYSIQKDLPCTFLGDPDRLRQVLINLLANAIKFTERGFIQLTIGGQEKDSEVYTLEVEIKDTGIGIAKENIEKLFSPFTQEDATTTRRFGGTGLGLSISKRILEANGGDILVESCPGFGSSFTFSYQLGRVENNGLEGDMTVLQGKKLALVCRRSTLIDTFKSFSAYLGIDIEVFFSPRDYILRSDLEGGKWDWVVYDFESKKVGHHEDVLLLHQHFRQDRTPFFISIPLSWVEDYDWPDDGVIRGFLTPPPRFYPFFTAMKNNATVHIPQKKKNAVKGHVTPRIGRAEEGSGIENNEKQIRVLLVEDNAVNQKVSTMLLEDLGAEVFVAKNGQEAVETLQRDQSFHVVLMDIQMPVMDGHTATEILRSMGAPYDTMPIVALSANAFKEEKEAALSSGMDDFLSKPVNRDGLARILDHYAQRLIPKKDSQNDKEDSVAPTAVPEQTKSSLELGLEGFRKQLGEDFYLELLSSLQEVIQEGHEESLELVEKPENPETLEALANLCHKLKGGLRQVGEEVFSERFEVLEKSIKAQKMSSLEIGLRDFQSILEEVKTTLESIAS